MAKYTFKQEHDPSDYSSASTVTHSIEAESLPELVEAFEFFLKGCGFCFDGSLDLVEDEESSDE